MRSGFITVFSGSCEGLPLRGRSPLGQLPRSSQNLDSGPPGVAGRALRRGDRGVRGDVEPPPRHSPQPARCGHPLVRSGGRPAVAGRLPGPRGEQAGSHVRLGCFAWANGRTGPIDIAWHSSHATGPATGRPAGAGGRDAECGSGADGDDPRAALQPLVVHASLGRADRPPGQPRGPLHRAVLWRTVI